ncbi:MAG: hypothetical protein U0165_00120 [Polyangiaceae bacterium]
MTIRGVAVNGQRPILQGVGTAQYHDMIVLLYANNFVFEGFEIIGDGNPDHFGIIHKADNVTIRDVVVHGVAGQGLLGTDSESGSLTLEKSEFYGNGSDLYNHQIYMATDETMYPGSVFRMQYCYVHDGTGGNNVKSRAERNEIYYNWIEGAFYHEPDVILTGKTFACLRRSDVVGNVLVKHQEWRIARIGGDGTGNTSGRYRFVNNTMVLGPTSTGHWPTLHGGNTRDAQQRDRAAWRSALAHRITTTPKALKPYFREQHWIQDGIGQIPDSFTERSRGRSRFTGCCIL